MDHLSRPIEDLEAGYDAVVVGSGYGGAIAASRLARAGRSVCVLERGREIRPGEYPDSLLDAAREVQVSLPGSHHGPATAMFDFHVDRDMSVLQGCGLGGTSLINAGVALRPKRWIFDDERWPEPLRGDGLDVLADYFERAEQMLGSTPYPQDWPALPKLTALGRAANALGTEVERPPINVTFTAGPNAAGVEQQACILCGDCVSGCNHSAKNTVLMNYLPDAHRHGAHIFTAASVRTVEPDGNGRWIVSFDVVDEGRERFDAPSLFVTAGVVVLAAGTLGSTEILLRSRDAGLPTSARLGTRFSGNGDVLAFAYDLDQPVRGVGLGRRKAKPGNVVGPCITGVIDLSQPGPDEGMIIEEGAIPGPLAPILPLTFASGAAIYGDDGSRAGGWRRLRRRLATLAGALAGRHGPMSRTLTYLVMSDDDDHGHLRLDGDRLRLDWPGVGDRPVFRQDNDVIEDATHALGGTYVREPLWTAAGEEALITVHPLGGCVMADRAEDGVVDERGRVFAGEGGTAVHHGLYVADGAVIPRPLGVNPLLTISAVAERTVELLAADRGWSSAQPEPVPLPVEAPVPGLRFTERMRGWLSTSATANFAEAAARGRSEGSPIEFVLTIWVDDLPAVVADPGRACRLSGTVTAPALSPQRLRVVDGEFRLLEPHPEQVETHHMHYRMTLLAEDGRRFRFDGFKILRERSGVHAWHDTTTLFTTVTDEAGAAAGVGIMRISPVDFARQLRTIEVHDVDGALERAAWKARFAKRFLGSLAAIYGGPLEEPGRFPMVPAEPSPVQEGSGRRGLRLPPHETRWCDCEGRWQEGDAVGADAWLRLIRYRGGSKGPVLLASGFGMAATSFLIDTVETNLVEAMVAAGYDVWLFDYRASIELPSSRTQFTVDDIAVADWPTAVAEVRRITGADTVQAFGHCVGSVSLLMALAAGLEGVRSAVCAQFTVHPVTSRLNRLKAALGVGALLRDLGVRRVEPDTRFDVPDMVLDLLLRALPMPTEERCGQALCRWINGVYGCTHRHAQLDEATHRELNLMFGVGNVTALDHMGLMMKKGRAVDHHGADVYLSHPERLALPILLVQGAHNHIFHMPGSERTLRWLQGANDPSLYRRVVLGDYAHLDALVGRDAARDVFPHIIGHFDATNPSHGVVDLRDDRAAVSAAPAPPTPAT